MGLSPRLPPEEPLPALASTPHGARESPQMYPRPAVLNRTRTDHTPRTLALGRQSSFSPTPIPRPIIRIHAVRPHSCRRGRESLHSRPEIEDLVAADACPCRHRGPRT